VGLPGVAPKGQGDGDEEQQIHNYANTGISGWHKGDDLVAGQMNPSDLMLKGE